MVGYFLVQCLEKYQKEKGKNSQIKKFPPLGFEAFSVAKADSHIIGTIRTPHTRANHTKLL